MKEIVVIDENKGIKNELPEKYKDIKVKFSYYYKYEFHYESNEVIVVANGYNGDRIYRAGLDAEQTVGSILKEADWGEFVIFDKYFDKESGDAQ